MDYLTVSPREWKNIELSDWQLEVLYEYAMTYTNDELRDAFRQSKQAVDVDEDELRDLGYKEDEIQRMLSR